MEVPGRPGTSKTTFQQVHMHMKGIFYASRTCGQEAAMSGRERRPLVSGNTREGTSLGLGELDWHDRFSQRVWPYFRSITL